MDTKLILQFLRDVMANNNRPWFQQHKDVYLTAKENFERGVAAAISRISTFDSSVAHIGVKDATYRFYRDTRFRLTSHLIRIILVPISLPVERSRFMGAIISIWNQTTACSPVVVIGCPRISSPLAAMRSWLMRKSG